MRWLSNNAIQYELSQIMKDREVIWVQYSRSSDKPFWVRRARVNGSDAVKYWLTSLGYPYQSVGSFIGTNIINWDAIPELPPSLRSPNNQRKGYKKKWNDYLLPKKCKELGIIWEDLWVGKSMLFDFDDPENPLEAFDKADKTAGFLKNVLKVKPYMIFSGGIGTGPHSGSNLMGWDRTEAEIFSERVQSIITKVLDSAYASQLRMFVECEARNSGQNVAFSKNIIQEANLRSDKLIIVQKPYMERRTYSTF